jgi:hypothetical protein
MATLAPGSCCSHPHDAARELLLERRVREVFIGRQRALFACAAKAALRPEQLSVGAIQGEDSSSLGLKAWCTRPFATAAERFA